MTKKESMKIKKAKRRAKREVGLSNRKKVGLGWDSVCKIARTGFEPRNGIEAKAHRIKFIEKTKSLNIWQNIWQRIKNFMR